MSPAAAGTRDLTEQATGAPSPMNDWVPTVRGAEAVPIEARTAVPPSTGP